MHFSVLLKISNIQTNQHRSTKFSGPVFSVPFSRAAEEGMSDDEPSAPSTNTRGRVISSYVLVAEYSILFLAAVAILLVVCLRSNTRLRTRLVYFYVITIIISLGTITIHSYKCFEA